MTPRGHLTCWTCGAEMSPETYQRAPREGADPTRRTCVTCFDLVHACPDPLAVMNMIRHAAGIPTVAPLSDDPVVDPVEEADEQALRIANTGWRPKADRVEEREGRERIEARESFLGRLRQLEDLTLAATPGPWEHQGTHAVVWGYAEDEDPLLTTTPTQQGVLDAEFASTFDPDLAYGLLRVARAALPFAHDVLQDRHSLRSWDTKEEILAGAFLRVAAVMEYHWEHS